MPDTKVDLGAARAFLTAAANLLHQFEEQELDGADALLKRARGVIDAHVEDIVAEVARRVATYDGLPTRFNVLRVLEVSDNELIHSRVLRWLLDPAESHCLQDALFRALLARSESALGLLLANTTSPIPCIVQNEVEIEGGRIDLVAVSHHVVLSIEVKVWASEGEGEWRGFKGSQTEIYRRQLQDAAVRAQVLQRMGRSAQFLAGENPSVLSIFVRPRGAEAARDPKTISIDWLTIEHDLALALRRCRPAPDASPLIDSFRSMLLENSGSIRPVMPTIEALRRLVDLPGVRRVDPLAVLLELHSLDNAPKGETRD